LFAIVIPPLAVRRNRLKLYIDEQESLPRQRRLNSALGYGVPERILKASI
jgi:hypothetical protein